MQYTIHAIYDIHGQRLVGYQAKYRLGKYMFLQVQKVLGQLVCVLSELLNAVGKNRIDSRVVFFFQ